MANDFVHLHVHTEYSLLDGLSKINKLVTRVKELEMPAVAITDHGVMYGAIELYKAAKKAGIKSLIGMEGYVVNGDMHKKESKADKANNHLVLIARDFTGYKNLMKISTEAHVKGFYYKPRIDKETLKKYSEGLLCLSACPAGELAQNLIDGNYAAARDTALWYQETFGAGNYFLEIQRHFYKDYFSTVKDTPRLLESLQKMQKNEEIWIDGTVKLSRELGIPLVATNDAHYIDQSDAIAQDALVCISTGKNLADIDRMRYVDTPTFYLRPPAEMKQIFPEYPDAISNTLLAADKCDVSIELGKWYFPSIDIPDNKTSEDYLRELCHERIGTRYKTVDKILIDRVDYELDVIITKGYASYFLMLSDMVNWCTAHGIITNTRGSAAGSIVSYILGITSVDPIHYALPFERFLNPLRPKAPDIDLDIADDRREELIVYVTEKYGKEKVAQICTFGRMLAKASVRDVGRVLGHPYSFPDKIAKLIPLGSQGFPMNLQRALDMSPELKVLYDTDPQAKQLLDLAQQIEGNARHISVHAAGTIVSPTELTDFSPLQLEPSGSKIITQYEMHAAEDVGLVKFDILGIRNLSILGAARDIVEKTRGVSIDLLNIPIDDKKVFDMLARGETMGVFQLAGSGMTKWLRELKPHRIEDIMIMIALFRPGPMANIPEYIARKSGKSKITYLHPKMSEYLDKSYGILVYQEDILFTALSLAGYDWGTVDALRQAIGKKKPKEMAEQHEIFVKGCIEHSSMTTEEAENIWELFVPFQGYGFNKAHAASYGIVSYQTAYLKANYPVEYMTALFTAESGNTEKVVEAVEECKRMGIVVLPPDINKSDIDFTIEPNEKSLDKRAIRFGLSAIKNVGNIAIAIILAARNDGDFTSLTNFCLRVDAQKVNRKVLESLIKTGALDAFGKRAAMLAALDKIRDTGSSISKLKSMGQESLFGAEPHSDDTDDFPDIPEFEKQQKLDFEKELLGFYLTEHPKASVLAELTHFSQITHTINDLVTDDHTGKIVTIGGIVEQVRNVTTKASGQPMCFVKLSNLLNSVEVVVFPKTFAITPTIWQVDNVVVVSGKVESRQSGGMSDEEETAELNHEATIIANTAASFTGPDTVLPPSANGNGGFRNGNGGGSWGSGSGSYGNGNSGSVNGSGSDSVSASPPKISQSIYIPKGLPQSKLVSLNTLLQANKGQVQTELVFAGNGTTKILPLPYGLKWDDDLKLQVDNLLAI